MIQTKFYKVSIDARLNYVKYCPSSTCRTIEHAREIKKPFHVEINKKIRRCANLGKIIAEGNGYLIKEYGNLVLIIVDYCVVDIIKDETRYAYIPEKLKRRYDEILESYKYTKKVK